jgi:polysaccharide biosynthesis transport protein
MSFHDHLEIVRRRKSWIILASVGLFVAMTVFAYRLPDIYRAETVILVDSAQVPDKYVPTINTGDIGGRLTTLEQQVLSPTRLKKLVESEGLYPENSGAHNEQDVIRSVQKSIMIDVVNPGAGKMGAFRIAYSGRKRDEVARIANRLAQMFIEENLRVRVDQTEDTAEFLHEQLDATKHQLDEKDTQLRAIKSHNLAELPESKPYHLEALANLRAQLQTAEEKIQQAQREKTLLQSMMMSDTQAPTVDLDGVPAEGGRGTAGGGGPYEGQLQNLESKLSQLRSRYGPRHPDVRKTQSEIDKLKAKATSEAGGGDGATIEERPVIPVPARKRRNPVVEAQIEKLDEDIRGQKELVGPLQSRMAFHESKLERIPVFEQQIARLQSDYDILKTQYMGLLDKEKAAEISHALEVHQKGEKFTILDPAVMPSKPAAPNRILITIGGLVGGLLLGIALAALAEVYDESVRSEGEAARIFGKQVLCGVPRILSREEIRLNYLKGLGIFAGTLTGSAAFGLVLSFLSGRLF